MSKWHVKMLVAAAALLVTSWTAEGQNAAAPNDGKYIMVLVETAGKDGKELKEPDVVALE